MFASARLATFAGTALVAGTFGLAAVATAGPAGAVSSTDNTFLTQITAEDISYDSAKGAIQNAHNVCSAFDSGASLVDVGHDILGHTDLSTHQAAAFVVIAVDTYCPKYNGYFE